MEDSYTHISPEEFAELNFEDYTLVDLREPDELIVSKIGGAVNIPFSGGFGKLDTIPGNKPVIVFCRVGDWSEQVAEILADRGYTVSTLDGGYQAYRALTLKKDIGKPEKADPKREKAYSRIRKATVISMSIVCNASRFIYVFM